MSYELRSYERTNFGITYPSLATAATPGARQNLVRSVATSQLRRSSSVWCVGAEIRNTLLVIVEN